MINFLKKIKLIHHFFLLLRILQSSFQKFIFGKFTKAILIENKSFKYLCPTSDISVTRKLLKDGDYSHDELEKIKKLVNKDSNVIFVGANIGSLSIPTSTFVNKCYMFEANPDIFELLKVNIFLNNIKNSYIFNIAISNTKGHLNFLQSKVNVGGSKIEPLNNNYNYSYDNPKKISVRCDKLDNFSFEKDIDLIFLDIEGSEYFALEGMTKLLTRTRYLIMEFIPDHLKNVSGKSPRDFFEIIQKYFNTMEYPEKNLKYQNDDILNALQNIYNKNLHSDGLIFFNS